MVNIIFALSYTAKQEEITFNTGFHTFMGRKEPSLRGVSPSNPSPSGHKSSHRDVFALVKSTTTHTAAPDQHIHYTPRAGW